MQLQSPPKPFPHPQSLPHPLFPFPQKHIRIRIQRMQLQSPPKPLDTPHPPPQPPPQFSSHPQPQFVAAKSLIMFPPNNFDYTYMICVLELLVHLFGKINDNLLNGSENSKDAVYIQNPVSPLFVGIYPFRASAGAPDEESF